MARTRTYAVRRHKPRVMRTGKTRRDHESGAWAHHRANQYVRRLENSGGGWR
jgi:hypothetical protein